MNRADEEEGERDGRSGSSRSPIPGSRLRDYVGDSARLPCVAVHEMARGEAEVIAPAVNLRKDGGAFCARSYGLKSVRAVLSNAAGVPMVTWPELTEDVLHVTLVRSQWAFVVFKVSILVPMMHK